MIATLTNDKLEVVDPSPAIIDLAKNHLTYTDKSKQYQLRRMSKNPWQRNSQAYLDLQKQVHGALYSFDGTTLTMPQGVVHLFKEVIPNILDKRSETGQKIVVPWVNKPHATRDYQDEAIDLMLAPDRSE